jgi:hypothetical protein
MKRVALLSMIAGVILTGACHAAEPGLCKSLCDADKRECRAHVRDLAEDDGAPLLAMAEKNPLARGAQEQVATPASRAIDNAGTQSRRIVHAGACDDNYLRCARACNAPAATSATSIVQPARDKATPAGKE